MSEIPSDWPFLPLQTSPIAASQVNMTATLRLLHMEALTSPISPLCLKTWRQP